jgi:hypothetical protein
VTQRLEAAGKNELAALNFRVSILFNEPPGREADNPFAPAYLIDAIGMTSRALYAEPQIWRPVMLRIVGDFVPAINKTYIQLNRYLADRGILPEIGAALRARSGLRPADDGQLMPLFSRMLNEIHPSLQAWRTLDPSAAKEACYALAPLSVNPYVAAATILPPRPAASAGELPKYDRMTASGALRPVLEAPRSLATHGSHGRASAFGCAGGDRRGGATGEPHSLDPRCDRVPAPGRKCTGHHGCRGLPVRLHLPRSVDPHPVSQGL